MELRERVKGKPARLCLQTSKKWAPFLEHCSPALTLQLVTHARPYRGCLRDVRVPEECPQEVAAAIAACMRVRVQPSWPLLC